MKITPEQVAAAAEKLDKVAPGWHESLEVSFEIAKDFFPAQEVAGWEDLWTKEVVRRQAQSVRARAEAIRAETEAIWRGEE